MRVASSERKIIKERRKELWRKIFLYLSVEDLGRVGRVCNEWREYLDDEFWKTVFEQRFPAESKKIQSKIKKNTKTMSQGDQKGWRDYYRSYHTTERKPGCTRSISAHSKKRHTRTTSRKS